MTMAYASTTTLAAIRAASPCEDGWRKLLGALGKTSADDEPLDLLTVLDSNGLDDALWVLSFAMPDDRLARHFQAWCADQVLHLFETERPDDARVRDQIAMLRNDEADDATRAAARDAAGVAAWDATRAAAGDAAGVATRDAARDAAGKAAWAATRDATRAAARDAAGVAAWDAAWKAARDAAGKATRAAARDAAGVAAWDAAWAAAWKAQERQLRQMLSSADPEAVAA